MVLIGIYQNQTHDVDSSGRYLQNRTQIQSRLARNQCKRSNLSQSSLTSSQRSQGRATFECSKVSHGTM